MGRLSLEGYDPIPLGFGDFEDREPADPYERRIAEGRLPLELGETNGAPQRADGPDLDGPAPPGVRGVEVRVARHFGDAGDGANVPRVVEEDELARPHGPQVALGERVADRVPTGPPVTLQVGIRVVGRFLLDEPPAGGRGGPGRGIVEGVHRHPTTMPCGVIANGLRSGSCADPRIRTILI